MRVRLRKPARVVLGRIAWLLFDHRKALWRGSFARNWEIWWWHLLPPDRPQGTSNSAIRSGAPPRDPGPNIAEGFGRKSPKEFARFLGIALASLMETRTHLQRGERQNYWPPATARQALSLCDRSLDITRKLLASKERQIAEDAARKQALRHPRPASKR